MSRGGDNRTDVLVDLVLLKEIHRLQKELRMDFTQFNTTLAQLGSDISNEIQAATAAIVAAQGTSTNPADQAALGTAVTALQNLDAAVQAATVKFGGTNTNTGVPPSNNSNVTTNTNILTGQVTTTRVDSSGRVIPNS